MASSRAVESAPPETATTMVSPESGSLSLRHSASSMRANCVSRAILESIGQEGLIGTYSVEFQAGVLLFVVLSRRRSRRSWHNLLKLSRRLLFRNDIALNNPTIARTGGTNAGRKSNEI